MHLKACVISSPFYKTSWAPFDCPEFEMAKILVIGGLSFKGRHFCQYIKQHDVASKLCVVDKGVPEVSFLDAASEDAIIPYYVQGDMGNPTHVERVFSLENWDWVFNVGPDVPANLDDKVYEHAVLRASVLPAKKAAQLRVKFFLHLSSYLVYEPTGKLKFEEGSGVRPTTKAGRWKYKAELELEKLKGQGLNLVILRPAIVYGPYGPIEACAKLVLLGDPEIGQHQVSVKDVSKAMIHLARWYEPIHKTAPVFNLADKSDLRLYNMAMLYSQVHEIKVEFVRSRLLPGEYYSQMDDEILSTWSDILKMANISVTPLAPQFHSGLFDLPEVCVDGTKIERETAFVYDHPYISADDEFGVLRDYIRRKMWPKVLGKGQVERMQK
ncbi:hypothetical protein NEOLI_004191 [Neolecta irregularis DAH-3]|uniref:NAD-dependent epimerase/dehydratase domain-containing protein n=1 Tax=Neolecta irregularis (strain DAH-3) TaxID=1198029 RepID=A0A1U7LVA4_NEOID|nr:hypothetical protein NEOLI_004191 [Neolecta irregularis DAH-3]|eukprot:OLL26503.1 hypothetical protein NEOLI_004191 [Neolecta irregularis DAH-3]